MKLTNAQLKQIIQEELRSVLNESIGWPEEMESRKSGGYWAEDILADEDIYVYIKDQIRKKKGGFQGFEVIIRKAGKKLSEIVVRFIEERECLKSWEVIWANAEVDGWGPVTYDIAMEYVGDEGLMADRTSVSEPAEGVWQYYLDNRSDVEHNQLDYDRDPFITPNDKTDDCSQISFVNNSKGSKFDAKDEKEKERFKKSPITKTYSKKEKIIPILDKKKKIIWS